MLLKAREIFLLKTMILFIRVRISQKIQVFQKNPHNSEQTKRSLYSLD